MVYIGSARYNENEELEGGQLGDQTSEECAIEPWYLHRKGWYVLRPLDSAKGELMAQDMIYLCNNDNIGYSYWTNCYTLYNIVSNLGYDCQLVTVPCDTNCSQAVRVCALYAGYNVADFYTGSEVQVFLNTGEFQLLTASIYTTQPDYLEVGDILVTKTQGHTAIVVSRDGPPPVPPTPPSAFKRRMKPFLDINAMTYSRREKTRRTWYM